MGGNIYCIFCGGPPTDKVLGPGSILARVTKLDTSHILTAADSHFLQTVQVVFADCTSPNGTYDSGSRTVRVHNVYRMVRVGLMKWRIDSERPVERNYPPVYDESDDESMEDSGDEDEGTGYDARDDRIYPCDPAIPFSGALAHTICLRLYALACEVFSKTSHKPPTHGDLWDSEGRPCVQYINEDGEEPGGLDIEVKTVQKKTLDLDSARGRVGGITYGTEEQCKQDFVFVPEKIWMLARPDRFPAVPVWTAKSDPTTVRRQRVLERVPAEMLTLLLQTIANGPDHPLSKGKTLLALAGTSPWLRYHITSSNLWVQVCAQAELLPQPYSDRTPSAKAVAEAISLTKAQPLQLRYDWMGYFVQAAQSPSMRNRQRIIGICEKIRDRLGFYRRRI